jgi:hypothetical protein
MRAICSVGNLKELYPTYYYCFNSTRSVDQFGAAIPVHAWAYQPAQRFKM